MHAVLASPLTKGAISGLVAAAAVDYHAFMQFHSWNDLKAYSWGTALFRWGQGIIAGTVTAAGLGWAS